MIRNARDDRPTRAISQGYTPVQDNKDPSALELAAIVLIMVAALMLVAWGAPKLLDLFGVHV